MRVRTAALEHTRLRNESGDGGGDDVGDGGGDDGGDESLIS